MTQTTTQTNPTNTAVAASSQYDFSKPVNKDGSLKKYVQYVMIFEDDTTLLTKREILTLVNGKEPAGDVRGIANKPFKLLRDKDILKYNRATKTWQLSEGSPAFITLINNEKEKAAAQAAA